MKESRRHFVVITWVCYPLNKIHLVKCLCLFFMESNFPVETVHKLLLTLTVLFVQLDLLVGQTDPNEWNKSHDFAFFSPIFL